MNIKEDVNKIKDYIIGLRREFHKKPEPSWKEFETSERIKQELEKNNIEYKSIAGTGIIANIGEKKGKTVALRADIDALEIEELNKKEYRSLKKGLMHACGHDGHTAMLLGAAKILKEHEKELNGNVQLIFQPAEELGDGAKKIIEEGGLEGVDNIFGIHLWSGIPTGKFSIMPGEIMASADLFSIKIKGKGGHGSMPHQGVDAAIIGASIILNLQTIVSREINPLEPAVVSIGKLVSGTRYNIIAHEALLEGTVRAFNEEIRKSIAEKIERISKGIAKTMRGEAEIDYIWGPPPVKNDDNSVKLARECAELLYGKESLYLSLKKIMGAEDFAHYLKKVPGVFTFVGSGNSEKGTDFPHHHPNFDIDEDALLLGTSLHLKYAINYLDNVK